MGIFDASPGLLSALRKLLLFLDDLHQSLLVIRGVLLRIDTVVELVYERLHAYLDTQTDA